MTARITDEGEEIRKKAEQDLKYNPKIKKNEKERTTAYEHNINQHWQPRVANSPKIGETGTTKQAKDKDNHCYKS